VGCAFSSPLINTNKIFDHTAAISHGKRSYLLWSIYSAVGQVSQAHGLATPNNTIIGKQTEITASCLIFHFSFFLSGKTIFCHCISNLVHDRYNVGPWAWTPIHNCYHARNGLDNFEKSLHQYG